jgi:hypothetical protein
MAIRFVEERALPHFPAPLRQKLEKRCPLKWLRLQDATGRPARGNGLLRGGEGAEERGHDL